MYYLWDLVFIHFYFTLFQDNQVSVALYLFSFTTQVLAIIVTVDLVAQSFLGILFQLSASLSELFLAAQYHWANHHCRGFTIKPNQVDDEVFCFLVLDTQIKLVATPSQSLSWVLSASLVLLTPLNQRI